jgi:long-chain acyl-CoA synthetase
MQFGTIRDLILNAAAKDFQAADSDAFFVIENDSYNNISFARLAEAVRELGSGLLHMGVKKGDKIGLMAENRIEWPIVYLAVTSIGAIIVPISILWEPPELATLSTLGDLKVIFTSRQFMEKVSYARSEVPSPVQVVCLDTRPEEPGFSDSEPPLFFSRLMETGKHLIRSGNDPFSGTDVLPGDTAEILFVSGSMGVTLSHGAMMSNLEGIVRAHHFKFDGENGKKLMMIIPFSHLYPTLFGVLLPLMTGWTMVTTSTGRMDRILRMIRETEPNYIALVPLILDRLYSRLYGRLKKGTKTLDMMGFGNIEWIFTAGSKCPEELSARVEALGMPLLEGYGVSEMAPFITMGSLEKRRPGSVGRQLPNVQLKILAPDSDGNGEVVARGPNMMNGYYGRLRRDARAGNGAVIIDDEGWLHTGDIGRMDNDGFLFITGRLRNIIVTKGGTNIYPRDIEAALLKSPFISAVKIVPWWNEISGEYPHAYILPDLERLHGLSDTQIDEVIQQQINELSGLIAPYKIPKGFELIDSSFLSRLEAEKRFMFKDHYLS